MSQYKRATKHTAVYEFIKERFTDKASASEIRKYIAPSGKSYSFGPGQDPVITTGVRLVIDVYGEALRKLADE